jgi:predicted DsbA family dithiol-disulfide isomerase
VAGAFYHDVSRAFFTEQADVSKPNIVVPIAEHFGVAGSAVDAAWRERRFSSSVDAFIRQALAAGATGVPALAWPNHRAIVGMRPAADLVRLLRSDEAT